MLITYTGKYVKIYFIMKITFSFIQFDELFVVDHKQQCLFVPTEYLPSE